ncbi:MAG TPA: hypothetical protein VEJ20_01585, partial [Candidatus Eremiobacteraceae bacterium]|nr:hypothetical protein [Candidatus Eremiobacteraceae bacterium]
MSQTTLADGFRSTLVNMCAVLAGFGVMYALGERFGVGSTPAILAAALTLGLVRRPERLAPRDLLVRFVSLPLIGLTAGAVGLLFLKVPAVGAVMFTVAIAASIWLRNFGERPATIGRALAIPFVTMLVVPARIDAGSPGRAALWVIGAGIVALLSSTVTSSIAIRLGVRPEPPTAAPRDKTERSSGPPIATRMAAQMLVALALAFAIGMLLFPMHWPWVVLSAFIVCSGAVGRGDAIHKGLLRLAGAIGGTLCASL